MCGGENFERLGEYHIGMVAGSGEGWVGALLFGALLCPGRYCVGGAIVSERAIVFWTLLCQDAIMLRVLLFLGGYCVMCDIVLGRYCIWGSIVWGHLCENTCVRVLVTRRLCGGAYVWALSCRGFYGVWGTIMSRALLC